MNSFQTINLNFEDKWKVHNIVCLNLLIDNYLKNINTELNFELGFDFYISIITFLKILKTTVKKDFLILILLNKIEIETFKNNLKNLNIELDFLFYLGTKINRKSLREKDIDFKFDVLISTSKIFKKDFNFFKEYEWSLLIINNNQKQKFLENIKSGPIISYTCSNSPSKIIDLQKLTDFLVSDDVIQTIDPEKASLIASIRLSIQQLLIKKNKTSIESNFIK